MKGYVLLYKKIVNWQWYQDANVFRLFIDLLLDANWEDGKSGLLTIKRGQCLTSLKRISLRTGLTFKQIRLALDKLESSNEIDKQTTKRYTIITIKNYDDYQEKGKQRANKGQYKNNNKEIKEINNKYIAEIINHLNLRTGSHYKENTEKTINFINARLNEGYSVDDFKTVIDKKCVEWMNTEMQKYLRPETLFGTKFESYLNQEIVKERKNNFQWEYLKGMYDGSIKKG